MRASHGDRCRFALVALCLAALLTILPAAALGAEYRITQNGTSYRAALDLVDAERFEFHEIGMLGERIPLQVSDVALSGDCNPCEFEQSGNAAITFQRGNYTLFFQGPVRDNHFVATFESPRRVSVLLPPGLDVRNPALGMISQGGIVTDSGVEGIIVTWNSTRTAEVRFYDEGRENLLYIFANFWIIIAVVLLVPFLLTWKRRE
ncbi:MAG TPA: DUF5803 family protein [Methanolinea sp.]|nr:DUF5803 family protein [Methanolinea sp.]